MASSSSCANWLRGNLRARLRPADTFRGRLRRASVFGARLPPLSVAPSTRVASFRPRATFESNGLKLLLMVRLESTTNVGLSKSGVRVNGYASRLDFLRRLLGSFGRRLEKRLVGFRPRSTSSCSVCRRFWPPSLERAVSTGVSQSYGQLLIQRGSSRSQDSFLRA